jgi:hypothetical protein
VVAGVDALVLGTTQLLGELVDREVERVNLSLSVASARTSGPLPVTVSSTVSSSRLPL